MSIISIAHSIRKGGNYNFPYFVKDHLLTKKDLITRMRNIPDVKKYLFDTVKLESLNRELTEQRNLGNNERVQEIQNNINKLNATQFDSKPYVSRINAEKNTEFKDSETYKNISLSHSFEMENMQKQYNQIKDSSFEYTQQYKDLYTGASKEEQQLYKQFTETEKLKVEDNAEYKKAYQAYTDAEKKYQDSYDELNKKTENIIRYKYDEQTKKLREMVYNPYATNEEDRYIDPTNYEAVKNAKVTKVEAKAFAESIKDLKDRDETFKNDEKKFNARVKEKENEAWFNSDEGQHMNMIFGKNAKEIAKGIEFEGPKGDDKK